MSAAESDRTGRCVIVLFQTLVAGNRPHAAGEPEGAAVGVGVGVGLVVAVGVGATVGVAVRLGVGVAAFVGVAVAVGLGRGDFDGLPPPPGAASIRVGTLTSTRVNDASQSDTSRRGFMGRGTSR
jgi:hypothetical protein